MHPSRPGCLALVFLILNGIHAQIVAEPPTQLAQVVVSPSRFGVAETPIATAATLTAAQLEVLPQVGDDLFRSIARLPGLASDDVSAQFWVRGAPHSELLARLDGVDLIEPFHLKDVDGALSIVDPATIRMLDLSTGGFTVDYGNRLAGVLTMETKSPAKRQTSLNLSLTGLGAMSQGLAGARGRWLVAARRGYPDVALELAGRDDEISPRYHDAFAKFEFDLAPGHTLALHALHARDALRYQRDNRPSLFSGYDSDQVWARWRGQFTAKLRGETVASWARLTWSRDGSGRLDGFPFSLRDDRRLDRLAIRQDLSLAWSENLELRGGAGAKQEDVRYEYALSRQRSVVNGVVQTVVSHAVNTALKPESFSADAFGALKFRPHRAWVIEPGFRIERQDLPGGTEANPRLNAAWTLAGATIRAAWGMYSQFHDLQDLSVADGERTFQRAERAEHRVLSIEHAVGRRASVRLEAYERLGSRVRPRWENLDNAYDLFPEAQSDRVRLNPSRSRAQGLELLLASKTGPVEWHASYALARTEERLAGRWVPRARDQRHAFSTDATYVLSPRWQFSTAWHFHSGWPTTDVVYSLAPLSNGRRVVVSANGSAYGLRLPDYHRLDLRATRRFQTKHGEVRVYLDVFNAYDRINLLGFEHDVTVTGTEVTDVREPREQLPFLPSVGITWEF